MKTQKYAVNQHLLETLLSWVRPDQGRERNRHPGATAPLRPGQQQGALPENKKQYPIFVKNHLMQATIRVPLRSVNPALVQDWQEKYPNAEVSVVVHQDPKQARSKLLVV